MLSAVPRQESASARRWHGLLMSHVRSCVAVLGGAKMLGFLVQPLQQEAQAAASGTPFDWRNAEAALYCIR